jgi:pimeloyl-ACP methyl ester carboxylesterase
MASKAPSKRSSKAASAKGAGIAGDKIDASVSYRPNSPDMGPERWINVDGVRTRYFEAGAGERIVFIHGVQMGSTDGSSSARSWDLNFPVLARGHHCISLDRLGQGYTDNPMSDADYTMHASVQHVIRFLDKLGKKPYHLVGHSRGGYIVTRITMERPDLVKSCVCVSSGTLSPGTTRTHIMTKNRPQPETTRESIRWYLEAYSYNPAIVTEAWIDDALTSGQTEKNQAAVAKMKGGLMRTQFVPQLARQTAEVRRWLIEKGMPCPTLIVWGRNDPGAEFEAGMQLVELFMMNQRETEMRVFNRSGHFVYREHAAAFNRMLDAWVRQHA